MKVLSQLRPYALATASCGLALPVAWPIDAPASCFLLAVMVSSLFGGLGPGLLSVTLSAIVYEHFFLWRTSPPAHEPAAFLRFSVFLVATLLATGLIEMKRRAEESRTSAEEKLRQAHADLAHVNRVTAMGELTASLAHEVRQPITAAVTDANTCMRWLSRDHPDVEEAREAASRVVKDVSRASEIITRIRQLFKKGSPQHELVDINELIREMIALLRSEAGRYSISIRGELANNLPKVKADRVQMQQVLMNLMLNGIEAMKDVDDGGELTV